MSVSVSSGVVLVLPVLLFSSECVPCLLRGVPYPAIGAACFSGAAALVVRCPMFRFVRAGFARVGSFVVRYPRAVAFSSVVLGSGAASMAQTVDWTPGTGLVANDLVTTVMTSMTPYITGGIGVAATLVAIGAFVSMILRRGARPIKGH